MTYEQALDLWLQHPVYPLSDEETEKGRRYKPYNLPIFINLPCPVKEDSLRQFLDLYRTSNYDWKAVADQFQAEEFQPTYIFKLQDNALISVQQGEFAEINRLHINTQSKTSF